MKLAAALLLALSALAQDLPQVRGTVNEFGSSTAIAGAQIQLIEFVSPEGPVMRKPVATVFSDAQGAFSFKPDHAGRYYIEASKPAYLSANELEALGWFSGRELMERPLTIPEEVTGILHFTLIRPGGLTGRVIDEHDQPVSNFTVIAVSPPPAPSDRAVTDEDGIFTFPVIIPTPRVIRVGTNNDRVILARSSFTKDDIALVEQDFETTYWPGGVSDPTLALPLELIPGTVANTGTIRLRKVPYYRAHLTYSGECGTTETWFLAIDGRVGPARCAKESLLDKLRPGSHTLAISAGGGQPSASITDWALVPVTIGDENVELSFRFTPSIDVPVRVLAPATVGDSLIALRSTSVTSPLGGGLRTLPTGSSAVIENVAWPRHEVYFSRLDPNVAVKAIRYADQPVPDGIVTLTPGATLEFVIDDQPAGLSGTAPPQSIVYVVKWPFVPILERPYTFVARADASGKFQIPALTAGEYRAVTARSDLDAAALALLLSTAPRITLDRGSQKTIELK